MVRIDKFDLFSSCNHDLKNCFLHIIADVGRVWNPLREFCLLLPRDSPSPQMGERASPQMEVRGRFAQKRSVCLLHQHSTGSTLHSEDHNLSFQAASKWFLGKLETLIVRFSPLSLLAPSWISSSSYVAPSKAPLWLVMLVPHWQGLGHVAPAKKNHSLICWPGDIILKNHKTYHMMKTEKPTKTRNVQLIPIIANVQKLISPSPENEFGLITEVWGGADFQKTKRRQKMLGKNRSSFTWEVVSTDFLRKQLVILFHDPQRSRPVLASSPS